MEFDKIHGPSFGINHYTKKKLYINVSEKLRNDKKVQEIKRSPKNVLRKFIFILLLISFCRLFILFILFLQYIKKYSVQYISADAINIRWLILHNHRIITFACLLRVFLSSLLPEARFDEKFSLLILMEC